ncbi:MAG: hypothetical protein ACOCWE_04215, partial [Bacillota bacterium]
LVLSQDKNPPVMLRLFSGIASGILRDCFGNSPELLRESSSFSPGLLRDNPEIELSIKINN